MLPERLRIVELRRVRHDSPGVAEEAVLGVERGAIPQVILQVDRAGVAGAGARIDLVRKAVAERRLGRIQK